MVPAVATVDMVALIKNVHLFLPLRHLTPQKLVVLAVVAPIYFMHGRLVVPAVATVDLVALLKNVHMFLPLRHLTPLWTRR